MPRVAWPSLPTMASKNSAEANLAIHSWPNCAPTSLHRQLLPKMGSCTSRSAKRVSKTSAQGDTFTQTGFHDHPVHSHWSVLGSKTSAQRASEDQRWPNWVQGVCLMGGHSLAKVDLSISPEAAFGRYTGPRWLPKCLRREPLATTLGKNRFQSPSSRASLDGTFE